MGRLIRRTILGLITVLVIVIVGVIGAFYAGVKLPVYQALTPITFANWNQTRAVNASVDHDSNLQRQAGRVFFTTDVAVPETVQRMKDFLDGGRQEIVACGPQKLYLHRLANAKLSVEGPVIGISGALVLELDGLLTATDDWPVAVTVRTGYDRTRLWADIVALNVANLPSEMVDAIRERIPRMTYTREKILDEAQAALSPDLAESFAKRRMDLDLAFEDIAPAIIDGDLQVIATISVDESALLGLVGDQIAGMPDRAGTAVAEILSPAAAQAQLLNQLKDLTEGVGKELVDQLQNGGNPQQIIEQTLTGLTDCETRF
ncbi:MAG: hypothetical protein AAF666_16250 [Pseudomonadota bacterium]